MSKNFLALLRLHALVLVYSLSTVFSKLAGGTDFFSAKFFIFAFLLFFCLGIYAFFWQKILSQLSLSLAYANRAADLLWGMFLGALIFGEEISVFKIFSLVFVFSGIFLVVTGEEDSCGK